LLDRAAGRGGFLIAGEDITDRKRMEEELLKAKKLEATAILAGGEPVRTISSLRGMVTDCANRALAGANVECRYAFSDDLWQVAIDQDQMSQVFSNIFTNAQEAMPQGGTIEVLAGNMVIEATEKDTIPGMRRGRFVRIAIRDHGPGIQGEDLPKIFDPYFSTKKMGAQKGMGLGLTIVYSVVRKHDGYIQVESRAESGTTVFLYLPAADQEDSLIRGKVTR
jgi:signal transduction histidine kinase